MQPPYLVPDGTARRARDSLVSPTPFATAYVELQSPKTIRGRTGLEMGKVKSMIVHAVQSQGLPHAREPRHSEFKLQVSVFELAGDAKAQIHSRSPYSYRRRRVGTRADSRRV